MTTRTFALIWGAVFLAAGVAGFVPGLWHSAPDHYPPIAVDAWYGPVLGLFPVNILHNVVHLAFGVWGLIAARSLGLSRFFAQAVAVIYAVLVVIGLIPGLNTVFGLVPVFGNNIWLHALLAVPAAYFGFIHHDRPVVRHAH
jgi:hypothetical protein